MPSGRLSATRLFVLLGPTKGGGGDENRPDAKRFREWTDLFMKA
jgi:hypothetical protein